MFRSATLPLFFSCVSFLSAQSYFITTLQIPGNYPSVSGINSQGDVIGDFQFTAPDGRADIRGFLRTADGAFHKIPPPQASSLTAPTGISDSDTVVGNYGAPNTTTAKEAFIYTDGGFKVFQYENLITYLWGISTDGKIVGTVYQDQNATSFTKAPGGIGRILPGLEGYLVSPYGINFSGEVVGTARLEGTRGSLGYLQDPDGTYHMINYNNQNRTELNGINDLGVAIGSAEGIGAFLYSNGQFTAFSVPGSQSTGIFGINNAGVLLGQYIDTAGTVYSFIATPSN